MGPLTEASNYIHAEKYREPDETFRDSMNRVANGLKDSAAHYHVFRDIILEQRFLPAGRIQTAVGSIRQTTPYNCYVSGTIADSYTDDDGNIMQRATEAAKTMRMGGGIGYDFSTLRPRGALIKKLLSHSSGPIAFMQIFNAVCLATASSGHRRGAQMGVMRCLAGDTKIHTLSGRQKIKDLVGTNPYLYAVTSEGKVAVEKAAAVVKTGERRVVTVILDNDTEIICTPDHEFMLSNGTYVEAQNLIRGTSLMALTKTIDFKGYRRIGITGQHATVEHRIVYNDICGNIPEGFHIHHKDEDKTNNNPSNLECLNKSDHAKLHLDILEGNRQRIASDRKGKTLEEWLGAERGNQVREKMRIAKQKQAKEVGAWNSGLSGEDYTSHFKNGFGNQFTSPNHRVVAVEDRGEVCDVFDITMTKNHNFFAEEVCVHNCDHPDVMEFIHAKQNTDKLTGFNVSVAITDEFMNAVAGKKTFDLRWGGSVYNTVDAEELWNTIMRSTWDWAEPGVLFIDRINEMNNLYYCETIAATNPCGEQPLPPYGACLLGSFNLVKYLKTEPGVRAASTAMYYFDFDSFINDIEPVVRAMDNVVDYARYPLPEQEKEAKNKRRMGLGVTGLANAAEACGFPYGTPSFLVFEEKVLAILKNELYFASAGLAMEKGAFPLYDERYLQGKFIQTLDPAVQDRIKRHGIRNSHLTSIAPTGTISLCADNVSSGLEPVFSYTTQRPINTPNGPKIFTVEDYGYKFLGVEGRTTPEIAANEHVAVLAVAQAQVDSSVSKTCNIDGSMAWDDFKNIYFKSWELGAKGCTTFNIDGKRMALLTAIPKKPEEEFATCTIDPETGLKECG